MKRSSWTEKRDVIMGLTFYGRFACLRAGVAKKSDLQSGDLYACLDLEPDIERVLGDEYLQMLDRDLDHLLDEACEKVQPERLAALNKRLRELDDEREVLLEQISKIEHVRKFTGRK